MACPHSGCLRWPAMSFVEVATPHPARRGLVTLNRPERMNAMAFDVMIPFRDPLREIGYDNDVRVVVITGAGHGFCSGADLEDSGTIPNMEGLTRHDGTPPMELLDDVITTIRRLHQPVIAAINGPAIGGGFCLALSADIRIAADTAYFRAAGINNGLTAAELGISFLLPRTIGQSRASESCSPVATLRPRKLARWPGIRRRRPRRPARNVLCDRRPDHRLEPSRGGADQRQLWNSLTHAACRPTWTPKGRRSSSCASRPRTSKSRSGPAARSALRCSSTRESIRARSPANWPPFQSKRAIPPHPGRGRPSRPSVDGPAWWSHESRSPGPTTKGT